jgi:hypothetical protein
MTKINFKDYLSLFPLDSVGVEIGVQRGDFSAQILEIVKPRRLHLVDCWQYQNDEVYDNDSANVSDNIQSEYMQIVIDRFKKQIGESRIIIHHQFSDIVVEEFSDNYFDWIYIDANHSYDAVKKDLQLYYPKVKNGGLICGDDYIDYGYYGVIAAVNDFVSENHLKINYLTDEKTPSYIIKVKK